MLYYLRVFTISHNSFIFIRCPFPEVCSGSVTPYAIQQSTLHPIWILSVCGRISHDPNLSFSGYLFSD
ncbi:hypothetical protein SprV_0200678000 [Sparganum proliferum]